MSDRKPRICVIGAGPSGMSFLYHMANMQLTNRPEVVCFEKQSTWGGLWNFSWMTGTDEYGDTCPAGMYKHLWSNGPNELNQYPDYPFREHFGKVLPSYSPRPAIRDYLEGRWTKKSTVDLKEFIKFNTIVRQVSYDAASDDFTVVFKDRSKDKIFTERFTYVVVANGIFNVPNKPHFDGMDRFNGRVIHSHDFRDASEFKGQRVLIIGASYSAEDVAMQVIKFGAEHAICSYRTQPMGLKWPKGIEERPLVQRFDGNTVFFKDGSSVDVDSIILCTGYLYCFPFLSDDLRLESVNSLFPDHLYKGTLWTEGGNNKLFYVGAMDQISPLTLIDAQALWVCKYITGILPDEPKSMTEMRKDIKKWRSRKPDELENVYLKSDFQCDYIFDLGYNATAPETGRDILRTYFRIREEEGIITYRDHQYQCPYSGQWSVKNTPWWKNTDDSLEAFLK